MRVSGRAAVAAACLEMHFSDECLPRPSSRLLPHHLSCLPRLPPWWLPHTPHPVLGIWGMEGKGDKEEAVVSWLPLLPLPTAPTRQP